MEIREIANKNEWEGFLEQCGEKTFLQSWNWGEFNLQSGSAIWRFGIYNSQKLIGVCFVYLISAKRGTFLFVPHGPVLLPGLTTEDKKEALSLVLTALNEPATESKVSFARVAPIWETSQENQNVFEEMGFRQAPIHMHPEVTWELNIAKNEEEILMGMRKTTRYLIRQAVKNPDIEIVKSQNARDLKLFWPVYKETAKRHNFVIFSENYLEKEFNAFIGDKQIEIFLGKYKGQIVSTAIFVFWQDMCFYHHSGSLAKFNKFPVSYLLQWEAIKEAKRRGCKTYNFWGIAPEIKTDEDVKNSRHPWAGLSLFKMGFGGERKEYVKTQDLVISKKYWINYIIEKVRKLKRGL